MTLNAISEALNPIVVKEVRQGLRTRSFWVFFTLMLVVCLVTALIAYGFSQEATFEASGPKYFYVFVFVLSVVSFLIIPYGTYRSLAREREDETWTLLTLTGLGARRILRGKLGSSLIQLGLYASAAGPFVLFSYYLNGLDLPTILVIAGLGFAYMVFLSSVAVSAATLGETRVMRTVVHLALLGGLLVATGIGLSVAGAFSLTPRGLVSDKEVWTAIGVALWLMTSYGLLLFEAAAARLSLATEDYAKGPRRMAALQLVGSMGIVAYLCWTNRGSAGAVVAFVVISSLHLFVMGMFLTSDLDGQAKCHQEKTRWFTLLRPGALRGFRFTCTLVAATLVFALGLAASYTGRHADEAANLALVAPAYVLLYLSFPVFVSRGFHIRALGTPNGQRVLTLCCAAVGCGFPPLVALVVGAKPDGALTNFLNPAVSLGLLADHSTTPLSGAPGLVLLWGLALLSAFLADRALAARDARGA